MKRLANESIFQRFLRKSLSYNYLERSKFKKNHGNEYTEKGVSDIDGHIGGKYVAIECKMWNGRPSTSQLAFSRGVMKTGGLSLFCIYHYYGGDHSFYWIPGDMVFSYRTKMLWIRTGLISVKEDPNSDSNKQTLVADCSPIAQLLEMR